MDPRSPLADPPPDVCAWVRCDKGPGGGPAPLVHTAGKQKRKFCCDNHRALAGAERNRRVVAVLPTPGAARHVALGDDVVSALLEFREHATLMSELGDRFVKALASTADVRAAQRLVDEANASFEEKEAKWQNELRIERGARFAHLERATDAEESAQRAEARAVAAEAREARAQAELAEARVGFETALAEQDAKFQAARQAFEQARDDAQAEAKQQIAAADARAVAAGERAAAADAARTAAVERALRAEGALEQLQDQLEEERALSQRREAEKQSEHDVRVAGFERALAESAERLQRADAERERAHERTQREIQALTERLQDERARGAERIEELREGFETRVAELERAAADRGALLEQLQRELTHARTHAERERTQLEDAVRLERARSDARVAELKESYQAQLAAAQALAEQRKGRDGQSKAKKPK